MIGIYKITNNINNNCYIGQSIHIEERWKEHKSKYNWEKENKFMVPRVKNNLVR